MFARWPSARPAEGSPAGASVPAGTGRGNGRRASQVTSSRKPRTARSSARTAGSCGSGRGTISPSAGRGRRWRRVGGPGGGRDPGALGEAAHLPLEDRGNGRGRSGGRRFLGGSPRRKKGQQGQGDRDQSSHALFSLGLRFGSRLRYIIRFLKT